MSAPYPLDLYRQIQAARAKIDQAITEYTDLLREDGDRRARVAYEAGAREARQEALVEGAAGPPRAAWSLRGIGTDHTPGCFVCGGEPGMYSNVSGFVTSKEAGEQIVAWFPRGARLDYREHEPNWIQVKVGACAVHLPHLQQLAGSVTSDGTVTEARITAAIMLA